MTHSFIPRRQLHRMHGFSLVTAIFLLVVLAGLGTAIATIGSVSQNSVALDVQGARAYQTARAGIEWGLFTYLRQNATCSGPNAKSTFQMPGTSVLNGFTVTVTCQTTVMTGAQIASQGPFLSAITMNSPTLTLGSGSTATLAPGMLVSSGTATGIVSGTVIAGIIDGSNVLLSIPAAMTNPSIQISFISPLDRHQLKAVACNQPDASAGGTCPNSTNPSRDYVQRQMQAAF